MIKIRLTGWLGKKYGKNFTFRGNTLKDGIDMLCANFTDFRKDFIGNEAKYRISVEEAPLSEQDIFSHFCGKTIKIIPVFVDLVIPQRSSLEQYLLPPPLFRV